MYSHSKNVLRPAVITAALFCVACAPLPARDSQTTEAPRPYPALEPIDALLAQVDAPVADPGPALAARAARLKARAAALGAP